MTAYRFGLPYLFISLFPYFLPPSSPSPPPPLLVPLLLPPSSSLSSFLLFIRGTAKQHVTFDYAQRLGEGQDQGNTVLSTALDILKTAVEATGDYASSSSSAGSSRGSTCPYENDGECDPLLWGAAAAAGGGSSECPWGTDAVDCGGVNYAVWCGNGFLVPLFIVR